MTKQIYIAGAHSRSRTARVYIEYVQADTKVAAFLVSQEMEDNPTEVDGLPVLPIVGGENGLDTNVPVYLGTRGVNHGKLEKELRSIGFTDIRPITMQADIELRNAYLEKWYAEQGREFVRLDTLQHVNSLKDSEHLPNATIYVATSVFDGALSATYVPLPEEKVLQVGTALADHAVNGRVYADDDGENISERNRQFCELTGLYWIWKHAQQDYVGLVHYRRHFLLPENWISILDSQDIDVLLPVPLYVGPSVQENYRQRHVASDWEFVESYFAEHLSEEYEDFVRIMNGNLYNPCNMLIAKREVLNELCEWLFPILFATVEHGGEKEDRYQRRYPGFLSERLITYFFESRRERYKVVYCNKNFLE